MAVKTLAATSVPFLGFFPSKTYSLNCLAEVEAVAQTSW